MPACGTFFGGAPRNLYRRGSAPPGLLKHSASAMPSDKRRSRAALFAKNRGNSGRTINLCFPKLSKTVGLKVDDISVFLILNKS
jgi:hypothetical protein